MSQKSSLFPHHKLDWHSSKLESTLQSRQVKDPAIRLELARVTLSSGLFHKGGEAACARALGQAKKVLREDPSSVEALTIAGLSLLGMDRPESAQRHIERALELDPVRADLQLAMGSLARAQGRFSDMMKSLEKSCKLAPDAWEPHLLLGRSLLALSRKKGDSRLVERAQFHLVRAMELNPEANQNYPLIRDMGIACLLSGRVKAAEKFFNRLREDPKHEGIARFHLGQVAYRLGKFNNAINHFRQYLTYKEDEPNVLARMALSWFQLGNWTNAREACRRAILIEPFNLMARHVLGCTLLEEGDPNEALRIFRETLKEHPQHMPSYVEIARTRRLSNDVRWLNQALQVEVSNFDRQPLGGELDSRDLIRSRIEVILEEFRSAGPSYASNVLRAIDYTQDEGLRFLLWETACSMVEGYVANETSISLRSSGQSYSVALGEASACLGAVIPERILTAGLSISEQDLQRAATERYPPAHDVLQHRQNLDKERNEARAYQALLLLAIAIKSEDSGQHLLREWVSSADDEMAIAARMGLVILGNEDALKELQLSARTREKRESLKSLQMAIEPATTVVNSYKLVTDGSMHCKTCGRPSEKVTHMMVSGSTVCCNICISDCWQSRSEITSSDDALCQLCGRSHFEAEGLFSYRDVDICSHCIQFSLGTQERENIEQYVERL